VPMKHRFPGEGITAVEFNTLADAANAVLGAKGKHGIKVDVSSAGLTVSSEHRSWEFHEPAVLADCMNVDPTATIGPLDVVQLTWPADLQTGPDYYTGQPLEEYMSPRILEARTPIATAYGRFGVMAERAEVGEVAKCWIGGVCLVMMAEATDPNERASRADTVEGELSLRPCALGAAQILWHDTDEGVAVVRITTRLTTCVGLRTEGADTWGLGEVLVLKSTGGGAGLTVEQVEPGVVRISAAEP